MLHVLHAFVTACLDAASLKFRDVASTEHDS